MRKTWKLTVEYDGTRYSGWQEQINARTVLGDIRKAADEFLRCPLELQGAGRTDAGVHALGQVAHLKAAPRSAPHAGRLLRELNDRLPADIAILECIEAPASFHARHDAVSRAYVYRIARRKTAFAKKFVWWVKQPLDVALMKEAALLIAGRHDFNCFRAPDPSKPGESPVVVVGAASLEEDEGDLLLFRLEASHFLWRMVRRLTGTLVKLGLGEITLAQWRGLLDGQSQGLDIAAWTAPASGLFFESVTYRGASTMRNAKSASRKRISP